MNPSPCTAEDFRCGIADSRLRCCCISFVQFFLYGVGEGGVLFNTHENHGAIAVFREKDRLIVLQDSFFDFGKFVSKVRNRADNHHRKHLLISALYHYFIISIIK